MDPQQPAPLLPQDVQQQVVARLKEANNVLVTVSNNPSVDQLAAAIGFTLVLNKLKKHGTAVFSGQVPSIIEFLQPEKTLEKNTDSLRDFIIALDKAKADKLRYKVEDKFVKIFITPYRTSLSEKDLEFSQGDFNVEAVVALGVKKREELDQAITAHGRILHDATVVSVNKEPGSDLGNLNLTLTDASSLSEIMVNLSDQIKGEKTAHLYDQQIATAFLTGIVAETERFSNDKTTPQTMQTASVLMEAGANQQLIATKLEPPEPPAPPKEPAQPPVTPKPSGQTPEQPQTPAQDASSDGSLTISHGEPNITGTSDEEAEEEVADQIHIDDQGTLRKAEELKQQEVPPSQSASGEHGHRVLQPPVHGGTLTANSTPEQLDNSADALSLPPVSDEPLLHHDSQPAASPTPPPAIGRDSQTLEQIEESVDSPHLDEGVASPDDGEIEAAREEVQAAAASQTNPIQPPIEALNAHPLGDNLQDQTTSTPGNIPEGLPANLVGPDPGLPPDTTASTNGQPAPPPPVPPPMMPPTSQPPAGPPTKNP